MQMLRANAKEKFNGKKEKFDGNDEQIFKCFKVDLGINCFKFN